MVIRDRPGWSVRETARESMLKFRARMRLETRFRTPGLSTTSATSRWSRVAPVPGTARGGGAVWAGAPVAPGAGRDGVVGVAIPLPVPVLDEVGQALARRHHREDVLLLGDLEPHERRPVDALGESDRVIHLGRLGRLDGGNAVGVGE